MKDSDYKTNEQMLTVLEAELRRLPTSSQRQDVLLMVQQFIEMMERVQGMALDTRMVYFRVVYPVFRYLHANLQLGRTVGPFDAGVRSALYSSINFLLNKYCDDKP